ncbi:hypothetical protein ABEW05_011648 [Botrytis cinerea]
MALLPARYRNTLGEEGGWLVLMSERVMDNEVEEASARKILWLVTLVVLACTPAYRGLHNDSSTHSTISRSAKQKG